jgi:AGZA family xanthine/uracil permease-like MFS transporter
VKRSGWPDSGDLCHSLTGLFLSVSWCSGGDWGALTQLFFDNLSTLLGAVFAIQSMETFGAPPEDIAQVVWGRIVPGVGVTMVIGNAYYTWMGIRLTKRWGRNYTAQPYGLNTPAAFAFVFNIMCKLQRLMNI